MARDPRLVLAIPISIDTDQVVATTFETEQTAGGLLLPREYLLELGPRLLIQLVAFLVSPDAAGTRLQVSLALFQGTKTGQVQTLPDTTITQFADAAGATSAIRVSGTHDISTDLQRMAVLGVTLVGYVTSGTGVGVVQRPTLLILRR